MIPHERHLIVVLLVHSGYHQSQGIDCEPLDAIR